MASLVRDKRQEKRLYDLGRVYLDSVERAPGIHVSDLMNPRLSYWRKKSPIPPTDREVGLWLAGRAHHQFILAALEGRVVTVGLADKTDSGSQEIEGIVFSPDALAAKEEPVEVKTNRRFDEPDENKLEEELDSYLEQLAAYVILLGAPRGRLWIFYLNLRDKEDGRTTPTWRCYSYVPTVAERATWKKVLLERRDALVAALASRAKEAHKTLPLCRDWLCVDKKGKGVCSYFIDCKPEGRYEKAPKR